MGLSRRECWSGLPCPFQGIFLTRGSNPSVSIKCSPNKQMAIRCFWRRQLSFGKGSVLSGKASCAKQGKVTSELTTRSTWTSRLRSAEQCGLWKRVADSLIGPDSPACTPPQNVFQRASGALPSFFPLNGSFLFPYFSCHLKLHKPLFLQKSSHFMPGLCPLTPGCVPHVNSFLWFIA